MSVLSTSVSSSVAYVTKGQIPLERPDPTGPDRTRPDEYFRVSDQVSDQVSDMSSSTSETDRDFVSDKV